MNTQALLQLTMPSYEELDQMYEDMIFQTAGEQINLAELMGGK